MLPGASVGRLAVPAGHFPTLEPVSFAVIEGELVVGVRAGSAGDAVAAGAVVAFEADAFDQTSRRGWSVVVTGPVEELDPDVATIVRPYLAPWPVAGDDRLLLIRSDRVTGQRVVSGPEASSESAAPEPRHAAAPALARRTLKAEEALALLKRGGQPVGRLVATLSGEPLVFPLNFVVDGDAVVFRTEVGTKLTAITRSMVTFEVDDIERTGAGWAVSFEGLAQEILDADPPALLARISATALDTWPGGKRPHVVRITPYRVEGTAWVPAEVTAGATRL